MTLSNRPTYRYQVGSGLPANHPTYVVRPADEVLYNLLQQQELCYVFNCRQMGKSSLSTQVMTRLVGEGICCVKLDLQAIGAEGLSMKTWSRSLIEALHSDVADVLEVVASEEIGEFDWQAWQAQYETLMQVPDLAPMRLFNRYLKEILLSAFPQQKFAIFIDEIDYVLNLKFDSSDFFGLIRSCFNRRGDDVDYQRLSFALFGVATPARLIGDRNKTPFNLGKAVVLTGFEFERSLVLTDGLANVVPNPEAVLREILAWTGGQPFLTQKLCDLVQKGVPEMPGLMAGQEVTWVEELVRLCLIQNWRYDDDPQHFDTIYRAIIPNEKDVSEQAELARRRTVRVLEMYQEILRSGSIAADDTEDQTALCLSGLVVRENGILRSYNRIYEQVFNQEWITQELDQCFPNYFLQAFYKWRSSDRQDKDYLLRGEKLLKALEWAEGKRLGDEHYKFLVACQELEKQQRLEEANKELEKVEEDLNQANKTLVKTQRRTKRVLLIGVVALATIFSLAGIAQVKLQNTQVQLEDTRTGIELERQGAEALKQFDVDQLGALLKAMRAGRELQQMVKDGRPLKDYPATSPMLALQTILSNIRESNRIENAFSTFSPDGKLIAVNVNKTKTVQLWNWTEKIGEFKVGFVTDMRFSPDSKLLAVAEENGVIQLWNIAGEQIAKINGYKDIADKLPRGKFEEFTLYFSSDSKLIAALRKVHLGFSETEEVRIVRLWNWSGQKLAEIKEKGIDSVAISPSGKQIATFGLGVQLWDLSGGKIAELKGSAQHASMNVSPDNKLIATVDMDEENTVRLWSWSGQQLTQFSVTQFKPSFIEVTKALLTMPSTYKAQFSPNGKYLATFGNGLLVWDVSDLENISLKSWSPGKGDISEMAIFSPDNKQIIMLKSDGTVQVYKILKKINSPEEFKTGTTINSVFEYATFDADGKQIAIAQPSSVQFWKPFEHDLSGLNLAGGNAESTILKSFGRSDNQIFTLSEKGKIQLWDFLGKQLPVSEKFKAHHITKEDKIIAEGVDGTIQLRSLSGQLLAKVKGSLDTVRFSSDGKQVAIRKEHSVQVLNLSGQQLELPVKSDLWNEWGNDSLHLINRNGANFSPDSQEIAIPAYDWVSRWTVSGQKLPELKHKLVDQVLFSPTGKHIVTVSNGDVPTVFLWDSSGKQLAQLNTEDAYGKASKIVQFSPNGEQVAILSEDGKVRLWSISGQLIATLQGHKDEIERIEYSPDSQRIATTIGEEIRLWSQSGQLLAEFQPRPGDGGLRDIRFGPDGNQIFTLWRGTFDGYGSSAGVRILPVEDLDQLLDRGCVWLQDYLRNNLNVLESDRQMCGITRQN